MKEVLARQGDTLDLICWRHYGDTRDVASVLAANPTLCRRAQLAAGERVVLPAPAPPPQRPQVQLWD